MKKPLHIVAVRALREIKNAGRKGMLIPHGMHTITHAKLVEDGLIWQEHGKPGYWKFTLSPTGEAALADNTRIP